MSDAQQGHFPDDSALKDPHQRLLAGALALAFGCGVRTRRAFATRFARAIVTRLKEQSIDAYVRVAAGITGKAITAQTKTETAVKFIEIAIAKDGAAASTLLDRFTIVDCVRAIPNEDLWLFVANGQTDPMKAGSLADALNAPFAFDPENAKFADFVRGTIRRARELGLVDANALTAGINLNTKQALSRLSGHSLYRVALASYEDFNSVDAKMIIDAVLAEPEDASDDERLWTASDAWTFVIAPIVAGHLLGTPKASDDDAERGAADGTRSPPPLPTGQPAVSVTRKSAGRQEAAAEAAASPSAEDLRAAPDQAAQLPLWVPPAAGTARTPTISSALRELDKLPATPAKTQGRAPAHAPTANAATASRVPAPPQPTAPHPHPRLASVVEDDPDVSYDVTGLGLTPEADINDLPGVDAPTSPGSTAYDEPEDDEDDGVTVARETPSRPDHTPPPGALPLWTPPLRSSSRMMPSPPPAASAPAPLPAGAHSVEEERKEQILRTLRKDILLALPDSSSEDSLKSILMFALREFDETTYHRVMGSEKNDVRDFGNALCETVEQRRGSMIVSTLRSMLIQAGGANPPTAAKRGMPPAPRTPSPVGRMIKASAAAELYRPPVSRPAQTPPLPPRPPRRA